MLNLLIAIMSDTFERVMALHVLADAAQQLERHRRDHQFWYADCGSCTYSNARR
eukprot:COSAG06_NODE_1396_length_9589_cov_15.548204_1_plen_53_part_10